MGFRKSKYSDEVNHRLAVAALNSLRDGARPMTRDEVIAGSGGALAGATPQKISLILGALCDIGVAQSHKARNGRMYYEAGGR